VFAEGNAAFVRGARLGKAMTVMLEREIKLRFASPAEARAAIMKAGATPIRGRRLQEDCLLDSDEQLHRRRCVLRIRIEQGKSLLTFKGPVQPSPMKLREEIETVAGDGETLLHLFEELGYTVWFRYQKYREEYAWGDVILALDETPIGTFVEIEGGEDGIMEIEVPDAECWYLAPYTVVGVADGKEDGGYQPPTLKTSGTSARVLRNDRERLCTVMAGAIARYQYSRARAEIQVKGYRPWGALVGQVLTLIESGGDEQTVGAPITSISWANGSTTIRTGFAR
jgi:adenylate cyclase class 2